MRPTIFKWFDESITKRKKAKKDMEQIINLSNNGIPVSCLSNTEQSSDNSIRLLDEGAVLFDDGEIRVWIEKGTLQKFYDELPDDYVGYINLGHIDLASMPLVLGTWTKQDLELVDLDDGRQGLNVRPHINTDLNIVQDLMQQDIPLAVSVEVQWGWDEENSELMGAFVANDCFIYGFSVVGNPANVNSDNIKLKGEGMKLQELFEKFSDVEDSEPKKDVLEAKSDDSKEALDNVQDTTENAENDALNESQTDSSEEESGNIEETEDSEEENVEDSEDVEKIAELMNQMNETIKTLKAENEKLREKLSDANNTASERDKKIDELLSKFGTAFNDAPKADKLNDTNDVFGVRNLKG